MWSPIPLVAGHLQVTILSAQGLAAKKEDKADPYVLVTVISPQASQLPEVHGKTKVVKHSTSPVWENERFSFDFGVVEPTPRTSSVLRLEVWDFHNIRRDKFLGLADAPLGPLEENAETELELELKEHEGKHKKETVSGTLKLRVMLTANYNAQRLNIQERTEAEAEHRRQREEELARQQRELEEKLISSVRMDHAAAEALVQSFMNATKNQSSGCLVGGGGGGGGALTRSSFEWVWKDLHPKIKQIISEQIANPNDLFDCLDINHDGQLDLEEVLFGVSALTVGTLDDKAELMFKAMDVDGNGILDKAEINRQGEKLYNAIYNYCKKRIAEIYFKKHHMFLPEESLTSHADQYTAEFKKLLLEDGLLKDLSDPHLTLDQWRQLVKENEMAQYMVIPESFINAQTPKIHAILEKI